MNFLKKVIPLICLLSALTAQGYGSGCAGRVDVGPAYVHIDVLESGKTIHRMDLAAVKADATVVVWKGLCLKPTLLYGSGHGYILTTGLGIGFIFPLMENLCVTPVAGLNYTYLRTHIDIRTPYFVLHHLKEKFRSYSPYIGLDASYTFYPCWRVCGNVQYAWSSTKTKIGEIGADKSHSDGASYSAMLEHDLNDQWSINIGGAYNLMLSKERHGLRGAGGKIGITRWF